MIDDVERTLATLTLEQKVGLLSGLDSWRTKPVADVGVNAVWLSDGPHGVRRELAALDPEPSTCFPNESALASTWDRDLLQRVGVALGAESKVLGVGVLLGPGINIKRTPLCGRNFEYLSEDPVLTGELATGYVMGVQSQGTGASLKHFAANNQEWGRHWYSSDVDERTLREIYLPAFERVVTGAQPWTVMCSYNRLNGVHTSQHRWLLTDLLRDEWGYDGVVVSDWGAVHDRVAALTAGLDLQMPADDGTADAQVLAAVRAGLVDEKILDRSVRRVLDLVARSTPSPMTPIIRWGEAENTPGAEGRTISAAQTASPVVTGAQETLDSLPPDMVRSHHQLAAEAAGAAVTVLRNDGVLPLTGARRLAVIGEYAAAPRIQGAGSSHVTPTRTPVAALDALRDSFAVTYAPGYPQTSDAPDSSLEAEAIAAVRDADVALVFVSQVDGTESEGYDRAHLDLPANQVRIIDAALDTGTPVVVVVNSGSVVLLGDWHDQAAAIVYCPFLGQGGGDAVARILKGETEPSGRLAETWPLRIEDTPTFATYPGDRGVARYGEGVLVGYRWYDALNLDVRYPFGHGLTYTTFDYGPASAQVLDPQAGTVRVTCTVTNTGRRPGAEVAQVYVAPPRRQSGVPITDGVPGEPEPITPVRRPVRELRDFAKVVLAPGEATEVEFELGARAFEYWDVESSLWRRDAGEYRIDLGSSSRDLRTGATVALPASPQWRPEATDVEMHDAVVAKSAVVVPTTPTARLVSRECYAGKGGLTLAPASRKVLGTFIDCNLAAAWVGDELRVFPGKYGEDPLWGDSTNLRWAGGRTASEALGRRSDEYTECVLPPNAPPKEPGLHGAVWFESIYASDLDGKILYALYHNENYPSTLPYDPATGVGYTDEAWPAGLHGDGSPQAVPRIGIMRSDDGGKHWEDRGILLDDHDSHLVRAPVNRNYTFPGGVGDPCAVPSGDHLYVFFGQYGYPGVYDPDTYDPQTEAAAQCVSVARIPLTDLDNPAGAARRWNGSGFTLPAHEVGVPIQALRIPELAGGGPVSAGDRSFFWGPSVSWNEHLRAWVMVMARADAPFWVGDSIWWSVNTCEDLGAGDASQQWSEPRLLLRRPGYTLWYPSLQPLDTEYDVDRRYTPNRMGAHARLWLKQHGQGFDAYHSEHVVEFRL